MKKIYFLALIVIAFTTNAQIVTIPNANFKTRLLVASTSNYIASTSATPGSGSFVKIDTNNDGEIQVSEAQAIKYLKVSSSSISDLTGIEAFTNLEVLYCYQNSLTSLNLSQNAALIYLSCSQNSLNSLNISQNTTLTYLDCNSNNLTSLNISQNTALTDLRCSLNDLSSLNISQNTALTYLDCNANNLISLNVSQNTALATLYCDNNNLINLDVTQNTTLDTLWCGDNTLTSLDVTLNTAITELSCGNTNLTSLDVSQNTALTSLYCNNITLTSLDVSQNTALTSLYCNNTNLTSLNVSQNTALTKLSCSSNQLESLFIKNNLNWGNYNVILNFSNNPNLHYICANEENVAMVQQKINTYGYAATCILNSYCSFTPGGTFYTISGVNRYDANANGCDTNDVVYPNLKYNITNGSILGGIISNASGAYSIPVQAGSHTITPVLENPTYFNISPASFLANFPAQSSPFVQDFCVTSNGVHHDLEVTVIPLGVARPGFDASYKILYKNNGNQLENTTLTFAYNDAVLDFLGASQTPTSQTTGLLSFNVGTVTPFLSGSVVVNFNLNSPMEIPALNSGNILHYTATANGLFTDETPADNVFTLNQTVVNSYDPNDKTCLEGATIDTSKIGGFVHYQIRFENTGTYPAQNVVVKDMIDASKFDISSLQMVSASHSCVTRINGNKVEFIFENINLPFDYATNDGYVVFKIKTLPTLTANSTISNLANIYFDYNFPIITNTATTIYQVLQTDSFEFTNEFVLYPNPAKNNITIQSKNLVEINSVEIYNVLGQLVLAKPNFERELNVSQLQSGNYIIKLNTEKGTTSTRFIKN